MRPSLPGLGPSLRLAMWNIERGFHQQAIARLLLDPDGFLNGLTLSSARDYGEIADHIEVLRSADVLVLQEVDWGMKRTGYRPVAQDLGRALGMNWAYGVEFVEVDRLKLGTEEFDGADPEERRELVAGISVDESRYKGLHGTAILSRYRVREARLEPFATQPYDWYHGEKGAVSKLELGRRMAASRIFLENNEREVRRGGRTMLSVTLEVPDLPGGLLTVAAPHLENKCEPVQRAQQMTEVLERLRGLDHPVIVAGDLNTSQADAMPTSFRREIFKRARSRGFWAYLGLRWATGLGLLYDVGAGGINALKNQRDPTARHVPVVAPNPESRLFDAVRDARFEDGRAFDLRGDPSRSINGLGGTLANSNERSGKGFATTYTTTRTVGPMGRLKLDWIFVKSYARSPFDAREPYRFAPHFGRTMPAINYAIDDRIADHYPISVDLPFGEPDTGSLAPSGAPAVLGSWQPRTWRRPAAHKHFRSGACSGVLILESGRLRFRTSARGHSRDWDFAAITDVRRTGPGELEVVLPKPGPGIASRFGGSYKLALTGKGMTGEDFRSLAAWFRRSRLGMRLPTLTGGALEFRHSTTISGPQQAISEAAP